MCVSQEARATSIQCASVAVHSSVVYHLPTPWACQNRNVEWYNGYNLFYFFTRSFTSKKKIESVIKKNTRYALLTNFAAEQQKNRRLCERSAFNKKKMRVGPFLQIFRLYSKPTVKNMPIQGPCPFRGHHFLVLPLLTSSSQIIKFTLTIKK